MRTAPKASVTACILLLGTLFCGVLSGGATEPLQVATMPLNPPRLVAELAAGYVEETGRRVVVTSCGGFDELASGLAAGRFEAVVGTCVGSAAAVVERGLVIPETKRTIYYHRLAILLPADNPRQIMCAEDLDRPGLRIGVFDIHTKGPLVEKLKGRATVVSQDQQLLSDLLEQGRLDALLSWDCFGAVRGDLVTIRLPRRVAGEGAAMAAPCFVARGAKHRAEAEDFLDFCASSDEARRIKLRHGLMLSGGTEEQYRGAGHRYMPVYRYLARQIVLDYAGGRNTCLDLGCGEGQITVELAQMTDLEVTGLDIEPEVLELGQRYAQECEIDDFRIHWVCADVHSLPYRDNSFDLVVSRGSMPFWRDHVQAVREILRVLRPGGLAFIGGGAGRLCPQEVWEEVRPGGGTDKEVGEVFHFPFPMGNFDALMTLVGVTDYRVITEGGRWLEFRK
ncbi:MAG: methyltransferase domain-containing protein [Armatimonadota bacterium]|nr:MAG: methyltransferase domain-containing protein [Armatimonadota bacterium]